MKNSFRYVLCWFSGNFYNRKVAIVMPVCEIHNLEHIQELAETLELPTWLVKVIIVEYLPCRRFRGNIVTIDYGLVTVNDIKSLTKPYIILNGLTLFHNITEQVLTQRILAGGFAGFPMSEFAREQYFFWPEGRVSPHCIPNPLMNSDEVEGDWKLKLSLHKCAVVLDGKDLYQWKVIKDGLIPADISEKWYESDVFSTDELEELRRVNLQYRNIDQGGSCIEEMQQRLEKVYADLESIHVKMRKTFLDYHLAKKSEPEAEAGYTEEAPPQLTLFDQFTLEYDAATNDRHFKIRSFVEPIFFHAAQRAAWRAREVRKGIDAGEIYPIPIAEEIEASAESIVLSAMCLEAYINGFVQDHVPHLVKYIENIDIKAKWLSVPAFLGKPDCFMPNTHPFGYFIKLIQWRNNDLVHYKHKFTSPVPLGTLGTVSHLHSVCNADNSELAVKTVREMIRQLNTCLGFPLPAWIQENVSIDSWMRSAAPKTNKEHLEKDEDDHHIRA